MAGRGISRARQITRVALFGLASSVLYGCLFAFEEQILALSGRGDWHFLIPVAIALLFSFAHGTFTSHFWDVLGIRARR